MAVKRLRIFAGPNGSGKSTFINAVIENPPAKNFKLGAYVNADNIEQEIKKNRSIQLDGFKIKVTTRDIQQYLKNSQFAPIRLENPDLWRSFSVEDNRIKVDRNLKINSYIAADIAEFIRQKLLLSGASFSYETVMSDVRKIMFLKKAKKAGYRIYLYYFATEDPLINISRVKVRVSQKGHDVKKQSIEKRYYRSLKNLRSAIILSNRTYLFDNSTKASILYCEITEAKKINFVKSKQIPNWFWEYVMTE